MGRTSKIVLGVAIALAVAFVAGWLLGASGQFDAERAHRDAELQLELSEARRHVLEARVSLFHVNFGEASRHLEEARRPLDRARTRLRERRRAELAKRLDQAFGHVEEAQRLARELDPAANTRAGEAVRVMDEVTLQMRNEE